MFCFLIVYLFAALYCIGEIKNAKLMIPLEMTAESGQRKEGGNPHIEAWNILEIIMWMISI